MNTAFDLVIRDGSAEDMAAEIMGLHAECLEENFGKITLLREKGKMNDLLMHASQCRSARCRYPNCRKVKGLFRHGMYCRTRASGGCVMCKKMWYLIQFHARACNKSDCKLPRCSDVKEHLRRLQQ
ncbi:histone acetyltransferase HAC1-like [Trifolium pratense]|uniref:histone acetyltransferase HAC1-like n=1 Tax=Trifolium pratense TaxID=57577 RepID=UPI001E69095A|nr:histone acetyltransferase HAC1-like [Trifolium pratense]